MNRLKILAARTWTLVFAIIALGSAIVAYAATPVPNIFVNNTVADATLVNANFQDLVNQLNAAVPPGAIFPYAGATAPPGFLLCDGSAVNRTTQAALFAAIGTAWGVGDGSTTFNLPDLRGQFLRGVDDGSAGLDPDAPRTLGSVQLQTNTSHGHVVSQSNLHNATFCPGTFGYQSGSACTPATFSTGASAGVPGETRPVNAAVNYIIKL